MRTTVILDDDLLAEAGKLTGIAEKTKLLHLGLEALVHRESGRRLARLAGAKPGFTVARRRRTEDRVKTAEPGAKYASRGHKHLD